MIDTQNNDRSKSHYTIIESQTTQSVLEPQIIPDGETWGLTEVVTSIPSDEMSYAAIFFGSELVFSSYSDRSIRLNKTLIGDGVKQMYLELKNAQLIQMPMGIDYIARKL